MWETLGIIAAGVIALLALVFLSGQRLSASRAKKAGNKAASKRFRRHSWVSLLVLILSLVLLVWIMHPAIIFDHIGL